jgi:transposase
MEAYSLDLRKRVLAACDAGQSTKKVAEQFDVSPAWVRRLKQRRREDGSIEPRPIPGAKPKLDQAARDWLLERVRRQPDATLEELRHQLKTELGIGISIGALWMALRKRKFSFKKSRSTPPNSSGPTSRRSGRSGSSS